MVLELLTDNIALLARYTLVPLEFALILFILLEVLARKKGITLAQEFHKRSFALSASVAFGWLIYFLIPGQLTLPVESLTLRFVVGMFMLIVTVQYSVFIGAELLSTRKTVLSLGVGAGLLRTALAVSVMAPMIAEDEDLADQGATAVMIANSVMVLRNLVIVWVAGAYLGLFVIPPTNFLAAMAVFFGVSVISAFIFYKKAGDTGEAEFSAFSLKGSVIFVAIFVAFYYLAIFILEHFNVLGLYALSGAAGFLYGGAHLFILTGLLFAGKISLEMAFLAAIFVTAGSILSDIPYAFIYGAPSLGKRLLLAEIPAVVLGLITLAFLSGLF